MMFSTLVSAYATDGFSEFNLGDNEVILSDETIYEGDTYTRVLATYDPQTGINYSRVDSSNYFVFIAKDKDRVTVSTYQKNKSRNADEYELLYTHDIVVGEDKLSDEDKMFDKERVRKHYESSTFLIDDAYTYYTDIDVWHLYCSDDWVTSGENASRRVLNYCEDFKDNLLAMDDAGLELIEILASVNNSANIALSLKNVVIAFAEDGLGYGSLELIKSSLLALLAVYVPNVSFGIVAVSAAEQGLVMSEYHDEYVAAFNSVKRLV